MCPAYPGPVPPRDNLNNDPVKQAQEFSSAGAKWLHIIDLDGAKVGTPVNTDAISDIAALGQFKIEITWMEPILFS